MVDNKEKAGNYVTTPTAEGMFSGSNDLRDIPPGTIIAKSPNLNVSRSFERTAEITSEDIGYTTFNGSPFKNENGATYDITDSLLNRTTTTLGDPEIFNGVVTLGNSAIEVIPRATTTTPGIIIVGDNLTVDSNGRLSALNSYVHPDTHPASIIVQDATHRFVTDTEKATWNAKANTSGTYSGLVVGSAAKWTTARTLTLSGDASGSVSIDGNSNVTLSVTVLDNSHAHTWSNITGVPSSFTPSAHNQASNTITAMTGYTKASAASAIVVGDSLNVAIGKLEKALDGKQAAGSYAAADHTHAYLSTNGGTINGTLTVTGQILSNADVVAYSDERLKTNVRLIENAVDKLDFIHGYYYNMLGVENSKQVGVIAQELQDILPEAIIVDSNGFMGVRYTNIIPLLINAVKELSQRVKTLEIK